MKKPLILITGGKQNHAAAYFERQAVSSGCSIDYVHSVLRAGGVPVILPRIGDRDAARAAVEAADGLLLTGGGDIVALAYGEEPHPASKLQDPVRDETEIEVTHAALQRDMPIFGICRGVQLLNVALGGTLVQDVPTQVPGAVKHSAEGLDPVLLHTIDIEPDSLLARILGTTSLAVNSFHHQAVRDAGQGLRVNCRARDGVIEGLEAEDGRPVLGVQFHPEEIAEQNPRFQALFDWLVAEAIGAARGSGIGKM
jgi:putative glutamine amidotransferase